ncbi:MAG: glycosyltransferase family 2 protein [Chloroflexota bacterium]
MAQGSVDSDLPFVSILMVNYNGQAHLKEFFESVFQLNYPESRYEVVVVDNASRDGSPDWIRNNYPRVKLICLDKNYGFSTGNNVGVKYCQGKFLALINNDTVLDKDWLIELVRQAVKEPDAIYGSKMLWYKRRDYIVYGGGRLFAWGEPCHLQTYARDRGTEVNPSLTMYADGCGELLSKEVFLKIAGFDESYFCYSEDIELSWKAWILGYRIYFVPTAKFYHKVSATLGSRSFAFIYYIIRNQLRNIFKFAEFRDLVIMLPSYAFYSLSLYLVVYCFQERKFSLILPIMKAYLKFFTEIHHLIPIRRQFQKRRRVTDKELKRMGLILTFSDSISEAFATLSRKSKFQKDTRA